MQQKTVNLVIGIVLAVLIALILLGGIKRIGQVTEKLVPFMAVIYVLLAAGVVLLNLKNIPHVFVSIFEGAFTPASATGGAVGSFFISMKKGVSRGIFSNEAGLGTGSIAHACADTKKPVKQGFFGIFEVFIDTIVICTLTALVILCSGVPIGYGEAAGAELRFLDLLLHMGAGYRSLPRLQCAALHFQRLSDGDFMEPDVLNFYLERRSTNRLWCCIHWLRSSEQRWILD